jgi:hypothetical protein
VFCQPEEQSFTPIKKKKSKITALTVLIFTYFDCRWVDERFLTEQRQVLA